MNSAIISVLIVILLLFGSSGASNTRSTEITVMTYNIFAGKGADGVADDEDIPRLGRVIRAQSPNFLGIQESFENQAIELQNSPITIGVDDRLYGEGEGIEGKR